MKPDTTKKKVANEERTTFSITFGNDLLCKLEVLAAVLDIPRASIIRLACARYIEKEQEIVEEIEKGETK